MAKRRTAAVEPVSSSFDDWLDELPDAYVDCRTDNHPWSHKRIEWDEAHQVWIKTSKCPKCRTIREQFITATGFVDRNKYTYEENYLAPKGSGRMDKDARSQIRLTSVIRFVTRQQRKNRMAG